MVNIDRRIDAIEKRLHDRKRRPESNHEDLVRRFAWGRFTDGLKHLTDFLPREEREPVRLSWSYLINPRAMGNVAPDPVPPEIENKIFEIGFAGGYSYVRSAAVLFDDPGMMARAEDLRSWDLPDLSRTPYYGGATPPGVHDPDLEASDWHLRLRAKGRDWRAFLKWYQDRGFGTFGPRVDFNRDHELFDLMGYEENYRINICRWIDIYSRSVVGEFIDLSKVNDLDRHLARRQEENKQRSILETGPGP